MASIAYITDRNMIEYHRLNGNHSINFWKPSNTKKISDFHTGDYLFFLAKGTEKGIRREKGLIGYGKFQKSYTMSFTQMWNQFKTKNGYSNKKSLEEAICKVTKDHKLPKFLHCLILDDLVFFQAPVYLSEIGFEISNKVESYIYLDKEDMLNTSKILNLANEVGVDVWSSLFYEDANDFIKDAQINFIHNIYDKINTDMYSIHDIRMLYKFTMELMKNKKDYQFISTGKTEFIEIKKDSITIYLPCIVNTLEFSKKLQYLIGHYMIYQGYIEKSEYKDKIEVSLLFNQKLNEEYETLLETLDINYEERLVEED